MHFLLSREYLYVIKAVNYDTIYTNTYIADEPVIFFILQQRFCEFEVCGNFCSVLFM